MTLTHRDDGYLEVDGEEIGLARSTRVSGGGASLDRQKRQGETGADLTFDGWEDRTVSLEVLIHAEQAEERWRRAALLQTAATARDSGGALQVWSLGGLFAQRLSLSAVIWAAQPEVDAGVADDGLRVTIHLREFDPEINRIVLPAPPVAADTEAPAAAPGADAASAAVAAIASRIGDGDG